MEKSGFDFPNSLSQKSAQLNHLSTFPSQLAMAIERIPKEKHTTRQDGKWSIQEHLGHLLDLEELVTVRIREILDKKEVLTPADMDNKLTWEKNYNDKNIHTICDQFIERRGQLVNLFHEVEDEQWLWSARHERLDRSMTILDLAYFHCQHDLYHREMILHLASS